MRISHTPVGHERRRFRPFRPGERGAVVVELAIVSLFLATLFAGTYDLGQAWRSGLAMNEASRTAARVGSARGKSRDADYAALSGAKAALQSSGKLDKVERVVIFKADATGKVPSACITGSGTNCQVITGANFRSSWEASDYTIATTATGCMQMATSKNWCPTTRNTVQSTADYYGVWIKMRHPYEFPILGSGTDIARTAVMRLEPEVS